MNKSLIDKIIEEIKTDSFFEKFKYKRLKFPTPKNQGICRYNTLQSPVDMGL